MMRKINFRIVVTSILILVFGCAFGASGVSALSSEGESLLSGLVSVGTSLGIDVGNIVSTTESTTVPSYSGNAEADLSEFLSDIGFDYSESSIIDLTDYVLNRRGSFEDWIYDNYGDDVEIPVSVKSMTTAELVMFLMGNMLYPDNTPETTTKYVFSTKDKEEKTTVTTEKVTTTEKSVTVPAGTQESEVVTEKQEKYLNGDVDNDGRVTASDARLTLRAGAGLEKLTQLASDAADVNGDGRITAKDARSILRYAARLADGF